MPDHEVRVCVFDGGKLEARYDSEPFTMNTPMGSSLRSWMTAWACSQCGLLYDAGIMPDPREAARERARLEQEAETAAHIRKQVEKMLPDRLKREQPNA